MVRGVVSNITNTTYLRDSKTGKVYGTIIKSEGLPLSPEQHKFTQGKEQLSFAFYFPAVPDSVEMIDMIEDDNSNTAFNFYGIALKENVNRPFSVSYNAGNQFYSKPLLEWRINGVKEIQVCVPSNMTDLDKYIFGNFIYYLQGLNIRVDIVKVKYENISVGLGTVYGYGRVFKGDVGEYLNNANTLSVVINYVRTAGNYLGGTSVNIAFCDYINDYVWHVSQFDRPTKANKYIDKLKSLITYSYNYNTTKLFIYYHGNDNII